MPNILRSSFSLSALMRRPKNLSSVKMTKILEQLFAVLRCSILNDIKLARSLFAELARFNAISKPRSPHPATAHRRESP
jgi:hypothetical protein